MRFLSCKCSSRDLCENGANLGLPFSPLRFSVMSADTSNVEVSLFKETVSYGIVKGTCMTELAELQSNGAVHAPTFGEKIPPVGFEIDENAYQFFPPLPEETYAALERDIRRRGIQSPIEVDGEGRVLDGHHRLAIARKLEWSEDKIRQHIRLRDDLELEAECENTSRLDVGLCAA